jgi:hypothetical protein
MTWNIRSNVNMEATLRLGAQGSEKSAQKRNRLPASGTATSHNMLCPNAILA